MRAGRITRDLFWGTIASTCGAAGLIRQIFLTEDLNYMAASFFVLLMLVPGTLGTLALRSLGGESPPAASSSQRSQSPQPSSESSTGV